MGFMARGLAAFFVAWSAGACLAQPAPSSGAKYTIVIPTPPGGGYDAYARLVARQLPRFLPGNPSFAPVNMPGAGSLIAANWLYNIAPKDGSAIGILPGATLYEALLGNANAKFDARRFNWLGSLNEYTAIGVVRNDAPFATVEDVLMKGVLIGASATSSDNTIWPNMLNALLGAKLKLVTGYSGSAGTALALERGEVQGEVGDDWDNIKALHGTWLTTGFARVFIQMREARHEDMPDTPTALELAPNDENREVLRLLIARHAHGRPFVAPPGTPPAMVETLRTAFSRMAADADFRRDAEAARLALRVTTGADAQAFVARMHALPEATIAKATRTLRALDP
jgi:tripartite-type tricarboxylate transporter receptor subunit TctC